MSEIPPPKIEFPCANYPIRVMGYATAEFRAHVLAVFAEHIEAFDPESISVRPSSNGRFESVLISITATGTDQLSALFESLKKHASVQMVL